MFYYTTKGKMGVVSIPILNHSSMEGGSIHNNRLRDENKSISDVAQLGHSYIEDSPQGKDILDAIKEF